MRTGPIGSGAVGAALLATALACAGGRKDAARPPAAAQPPGAVAPASTPSAPGDVAGTPPGDAAAELARGREDRAQGRLADASLHLERALRADPSSLDARLGLVETLLERSVDLGRARTLLDEAQALRPDDVRPERLRGWLDELQGDDAAAAADYGRVLARTSDPELRVRRANLLLRSDQAEAAVQELERAAEERPADRAVRTTLAELYEARGRTADAETMLVRVTELAPSDAAAQLRLAAFYRRHGDLVRALEAEARARSLEGAPRALRPLRPSRR